MEEVSAAVAQFPTLPQHEQRVLIMLLVLHGAVTRSDLCRVLRDAGVRNERDRQISTQQLLPLLERWRAAGWVQEAEGGWLVTAHHAPSLARHLKGLASFTGTVDAVRLLEPLLERHSASARIERLARELWLAAYVPAHPELERALSYFRATRRGAEGDLWLRAYGSHAPGAVLREIGLDRATRYLESALPAALDSLSAVGAGALEFMAEQRAQLPAEICASGAQYLALRADFAAAAALLEGRDTAETRAARAFVALLEGDLPAARGHARQALERTRTKSSKRIKGVQHPLAAWVSLLLLTDQADPESQALGGVQLECTEARSSDSDTSVAALKTIVNVCAGADVRNVDRNIHLRHGAQTWSELALWCAALHVARAQLPADMADKCLDLGRRARASGFTSLPKLFAPKYVSLLWQPEAPWRRALRGLEQAIASASPTTTALETKPERVVWVLGRLVSGAPVVTPRVQTLNARGYTSGRAVSLKRLAELDPQDTLLDSYDRLVTRFIVEVRDPYSYGWSTSFQLQPDAAVALVGHPRVFADTECTRPLKVERRSPTLHVRQNDDASWTLTAYPSARAEDGLYLDEAEDGRAILYVASEAQRNVLAQLPESGLSLPHEASAEARRVLGKLAPLFPMSSALELDAPEVEEVAPDARVYVQLRRIRGGVRVALSVAPLANATRLVPGEGNPVMMGTRAGATIRCTRDLAHERRELTRVRTACPTLTSAGNELVLQVGTLLESLELLEELRALGERVVIEWPEGDPLTIAGEGDLKQLRVQIHDAGAWLEADGQLEVDATLTLSFRSLVVREQPRYGRFVALDDGRYLALSEALRRSIEAAEAWARVEEERLTLHPLAAIALEGAQLTADTATSARLARAREAAELTFEPPPTFQASLRPYQREGFTFLRRLLHWGAGACLADDMGLGKTLQTLALLVDQAPHGPALVVAPTSVCGNWFDEARKFAPTLRVKRITSGDRARQLSALGPFDLLVCSYGVLQQERKRLAEVTFQVAVLDEAQAIKNANTQRARAANELQATHRLALTGTPIENHLGELWSILQFVNPGLLGSEREFEQRFARPIQREGDRERAQLLKRVVAPFVLRRKKSEVLDDLPEKTVITLRVEASAEELALFAALREEAVARIQRSEQPAQARMQLFAELMRMRRAACHPSLVLPDSPLASSKLAMLETLLEELRDNGHRVLVFSQFVDYLRLVRARLDVLGIRYQYLDGSSSSAARSSATAAFQAGEGEVFLISLKAGGFGLNLTAADYVIHLDPWWNPAVEDQASDRAHRIGQTRPVTIYRLVMQGSIEEKILGLHASKRALSNDLLDGTGSTAPADIDELLALLADAHAPIARELETSLEA